MFDLKYLSVILLIENSVIAHFSIVSLNHTFKGILPYNWPYSGYCSKNFWFLLIKPIQIYLV